MGSPSPPPLPPPPPPAEYPKMPNKITLGPIYEQLVFSPCYTFVCSVIRSYFLNIW